MVFTKIYQRFSKYIECFSTYISDFSLYRRFDTTYRPDIFRQPVHPLCRHTKEATHGNFFSIPHPVFTEIYQRFFKYIECFSTYISDFFIISAIRHNLSTYRHFSATCSSSMPVTTIKKLPHGNFFPHTHPVFTEIYQRFFKYIECFSTYISDFSLYRRFDTTYRPTDIFRHSKRTIYPIPKQFTAELYD